MTDTQHPAASNVKPFAHPGGTSFASPAPENRLGKQSTYVLAGLAVALVLLVAYQQFQISQLSGQLATMNDALKASDVKNRLESQEQSLGELNNRLAYLDSKINATNQTAQEALKRIKAHEDKDIIGKWVDGLKQAMGLR
ncbi:hypothetical protein [Vampirovibrio chlorellavorus]|uniref:hypothetical protein n=1 Tax=Vampirovibrio chlorellavorus TaxID=758823 RepID=UPI0026ECE228|nr:hypothetical protein [Vampirovibrio chlorellavorus]